MKKSIRGLAGSLALLAALQGCALTPGGLRGERAALGAAGDGLRRGEALADLPSPTNADDWRSVLARALLANGDLRAAWFEWKAAVEKVPGASAWPNSNISLGYSYLFSGGRMKTFDRMSFSVGADPMQNLSFPGKAMTAGRAALDEARAAGEKFRAEKFALQRRVLEAWLDLAGAAEEARLAEETAVLAEVSSQAADAAVAAGEEAGKALGADIAQASAQQNRISALASITEAKATLAALGAFASPQDIATPTMLPSPRALPPEAPLLAALDKSPEVGGLAAEQRARAEEKHLADLQWIPDVNPTAVFTGSVEQGVGAILVLPTKFAEIRSGIAVARAMRRAASSRLAQAARNQLGELRASLSSVRNQERARRLLEENVLPAAAAAAATAETSYAASAGDLAQLLEARLLVVEVRQQIAEAAIAREKGLAAVEALLGADLETFTQEGAVASSEEQLR